MKHLCIVISYIPASTESWPPPPKLTYQPLTMANVQKTVSANWDLLPFCLKHVCRCGLYRRIHCKKIYELNQFEPSMAPGMHQPQQLSKTCIYIKFCGPPEEICNLAPFRGFVGCQSAWVKISGPINTAHDRIGGCTKPPRLTRTDKCISVVDPNNSIAKGNHEET